MLLIAEIVSQLSPRQMAALIWTIVFIIAILFVQRVRASILGFWSSLFQKEILIPYLTITAFAFGILCIFYRIHAIHSTHIILLITWYGAFVVTTFFTLHLTKPSAFVLAMIKSIFTMSVVVDFIVNLQSFSLVVELVMVPIVGIASVLIPYTDNQPEYSSVNRVVTRFLALIGFAFVLYSIIATIHAWNSFTMKKALWDLALPLLLSVAMIPPFYLLKVYSAYNSLFARIRMFTPLKNQRRALMRAAILFCHFRPVAIHTLELKWPRRLHTEVNDPKQYIYDIFYSK